MKSQELSDTLAETAQAHGVIGARMTGAGFGGCGIAIVETDKVAQGHRQFMTPIWLSLAMNQPLCL